MNPSLFIFLDSNSCREETTKVGEDIVSSFQKGEIPFEEVIKQYWRVILDRSKIWIPGYSEEDIFQELLIKLHHCCLRWDSTKGVKFITYLYKSLNTHILHLRRKSLRDRRKANNDSMSIDFLLEEVEGDSTELGKNKITLTIEEESFDIIEIMETDLTNNERVCIEMIFEGSRYSDIADKLDLSRVRISQIVRGLKPKLSTLIY